MHLPVPRMPWVRIPSVAARPPARPGAALTALALLGALPWLTPAPASAGPTPVTPPTLGSANTATADPAVVRPAGTPCRVTLFTDLKFADFNAQFFPYAPPAACPGPWKAVVLEADFSVEAGRQFDRTAQLWIGGANIYFGTTAEPSASTARAWHIERDLTDYSAVLAAPSTGRADLGNLVNDTYTSALWGSATLAFYPASHDDDDKSASPDLVLPLSAGPTGGTVALADASTPLSASFQLPRNIERAVLDVVLQHQGANDEFWYTCVPTELSGALQSCAGTAFREGQLSIDGQPAGVVPIYPWIFTGGIDPYFWRPIPAPQALNFIPYRVDITPFAALLDDGQPHTFAIVVTNDSGYFSTTANLLLYLDHGARQLTGGLTANTIAAPAPVITPDLVTAADGTVTGTVNTQSSRAFVLSGWLRTSHGVVSTELRQTISFSNVQHFVSPASLPETFIQNITQSTTVASTTRVRQGGDERRTSAHLSWPLTVDLTVNIGADGSFSQTGAISQGYKRVDVRDGRRSVVSNSGRWGDTYPTKAGQSGFQRYFSLDAGGRCYSRALTAIGGVLTAIQDGQGCSD